MRERQVRRNWPPAKSWRRPRQPRFKDSGLRQADRLSEKTALGEFDVFQRGGYTSVIGMLGAWPPFHTRADRADVATTSAVLEAVGAALRRMLQSRAY